MTSKKARSCDSCARRRARWYCAADDAFLCHGCDASVHSANPLSRRHHRLRIRSAPDLPKSPRDDPCPAWLRGFKRKARTPRPHSKTVSSVVPELETSEENTNEEAAAAAAEEEEEEQKLLYRVPVYDPILDEYCEPAPTEENPLADYNCNSGSSSNDSRTSSDCLVGFLPSETELAEFAADMESLLGRGLENDSFPMGELRLGDAGCGLVGGEQTVKEELDGSLADAGSTELYENMCISRETLDVNFDDCGSPTTEEEDELERTKAEAPVDECPQQRKKVGLRLDHQAVIAEWSVQGPSSSPWIDGERPQFGPDDCWLDCMGMWGGGDQVRGLALAEAGGGHVDEGREARVSRYREKRRTRLFSKKIRYEVRKLNAEKRPRMKGRFVKRSSFAAATPY